MVNNRFHYSTNVIAKKKISYASFVSQGVDQETIDFYNKKHPSSIYGGKTFIENHINKIEKSYINQVLQDINHTRPLPKKENIMDSIKSYFNISLNQMINSKKGEMNIPKLIAMYLLSQLGQVKHKEISQLFGGLKERSVSTQVIRLRKKLVHNSCIKKQIIEITNMINNQPVS